MEKKFLCQRENEVVSWIIWRTRRRDQALLIGRAILDCGHGTKRRIAGAALRNESLHFHTLRRNDRAPLPPRQRRRYELHCHR